MSDKPLVQQQLAQELSELVLMVAGINTRADETDNDISSKKDSLQHVLVAFDFYEGFWQTIQAEWLGVDKFRIDKYYMLMRRFVHAGLQLLLLHACDKVLVDRYIHIMRGTQGPLASNNVQVPDSITYHVCDIFLDELETALAAHANAMPSVPLVPTLDLLVPFMDLAATSTSKRMHERVMEHVILPFLQACEHDMHTKAHDKKKRKTEEGAVDAPYKYILTHTTLDGKHVAGAGDMYETALHRLVSAASAPDTYAPSRRKMYALWQEAQEE